MNIDVRPCQSYPLYETLAMKTGVQTDTIDGN